MRGQCPILRSEETSGEEAAAFVRRSWEVHAGIREVVLQELCLLGGEVLQFVDHLAKVVLLEALAEHLLINFEITLPCVRFGLTDGRADILNYRRNSLHPPSLAICHLVLLSLPKQSATNLFDLVVVDRLDFLTH